MLRYAQTHGRLAVWVHGHWRVWIALWLVLPIVLCVSWTIPFIGLALLGVIGMHHVERPGDPLPTYRKRWWSTLR
jgi:hypothetical protein